MYLKTSYRETDRMIDLVNDNYQMLLLSCRFGIGLGFGDKNIGEVCRQYNVDTTTFVSVVNFLVADSSGQPIAHFEENLSLDTLTEYLHNSHNYFMQIRFPHLRSKLTEAIAGDCGTDVVFIITKFFDEYREEVNRHMMYEEKMVFPYVRKLLNGEKDSRYNISIFSKRHDQIELKIIELKNILLKYYPGKGGNMLNSAIFDIFTTEQDLATHNSIEDHLFTPAIIKLEKQLSNDHKS